MKALIVASKPSDSVTYLLNETATFSPSVSLYVGDEFDYQQVTKNDFVFFVDYAVEYAKLGLKCTLNDNAYKAFELCSQGRLSQFDLASKCFLPEGFTHLTPIVELSLAVYGFVGSALVFILPSSYAACRQYFSGYIVQQLLQKTQQEQYATIKLMGVDKRELNSYCQAMSSNGVRLRLTEQFGDISIDVLCNSAAVTVAASAVTALTRKFREQIYCCSHSTLQQTVVDLLIMKSKTLALAESVTGGLIAAKLVDISGASQVLKEGIVAYTNESKRQRLAVKRQTLDSYTAVSSQTAVEMAQGVRCALDADYALSITGYAERPNTLDFSQDMCYICIADRDSTQLHGLNLTGERNETRQTLANYALFYLLNYIKTH